MNVTFKKQKRASMLFFFNYLNSLKVDLCSGTSKEVEANGGIYEGDKKSILNTSYLEKNKTQA